MCLHKHETAHVAEHYLDCSGRHLIELSLLSGVWSQCQLWTSNEEQWLESLVAGKKHHVQHAALQDLLASAILVQEHHRQFLRSPRAAFSRGWLSAIADGSTEVRFADTTCANAGKDNEDKRRTTTSSDYAGVGRSLPGGRAVPERRSAFGAALRLQRRWRRDYSHAGKMSNAMVAAQRLMVAQLHAGNGPRGTTNFAAVNNMLLLRQLQQRLLQTSRPLLMLGHAGYCVRKICRLVV